MKATRFLRFAATGAFALLFVGGSARSEDVYHDNVVIILDASGSMAEFMRRTGTRKMAAAKAALREVLRQVPETTHVGLLVFSGRNVRNHWVYPLGPRDDARLIKAIDLPVPGGGTPLGKYIKIGADRLLQERAKQLGYGTYRLLVVTDGEAGDKHLVEKYTPEVVARGITVDVIGVDMKGTHTLATKVHSYRSADDPMSLKKAIAEVFAEVSSTGTDAAQAEAFDVLAPIPTGLVTVMIEALSTSGNHPVGERPAVGGKGRAAERRRKAVGHKPVGGQAPTTRQPADGGGAGSTVIIVVVVGIIVLGAVIKRRRRGL